MKFIALLIGALMILLGLTGVFWPEGLLDLTRYSFTPKGLYVTGFVRIAIGALLFMAARGTRTPKTLRVFGVIILVAGVATLFVNAATAEAIREAWLQRGPDAIRIIACLPLAAGLFIGGSALFKEPKS